jgi:hypothetical protein
VSLNYDTTDTTDPLNSTNGTIALTGISAGTAHFETGSLMGHSPDGYLQVPYGTATGDPTSGTTYTTGDFPFAPTWNNYSNFTVPLTAAYEFTLEIPTTSLLKATALPDTGPESNPGPYVALRLYIYGPGGVNMYDGEYVSGLVESVTGNAYGTEGFPGSTKNVFYMNGVNLVAGVTYSFLLQYIVFNVDYNNVLDINYFIPNTTVSYNAAVASSNLNQSGITLGQDTDRYIFTKAGLLDFYDPFFVGNEGAKGRQTIGEIAGPFILYNSDTNGHHSSNQRIYINQASFPRSNRAAGGNFLTSHFFGGFNRSFLPIRAYGIFTPTSSTNHTIYSTTLWPFSFNIETVTYVTTNKFAVTFVEPLLDNVGYSTQSTSKSGVYTVQLVSHDSGLSLVTVTNVTYFGFTMELSGEVGAKTVGIVVYK